jgi:rod shape-determining protein MreC
MTRAKRHSASTLTAIAATIAVAFLCRGLLMQVFSMIERPMVAAGTWTYVHAVGIFDAAAVSPSRFAALEAQREAAAVDRAELERLRDENEELRAELAFETRTRMKGITASITGRTLGPDASAFLIDRGSDNGIRVGDPAVSGDGILVGKILDVGPTSATVRVLSDRESVTAVSFLNEARTIGIARGMSGTLLELDYIPQDERVSVNDVVVTSGLEENVPSGLLVGIVNSVRGDPSAAFQGAVLEPLCDVRRIQTVSVIVSRTL